MSMQAWWKVWPGLYDKEIESFKKFGATLEVLFKSNGVLIVGVDWPVEGGENIRLRIGFSSLHPFFRPAVSAPDLDLERHQNPRSKDLCLLTQEPGQWNSHQLVAEFLEERLGQLFATLDARKEERWEDAAALEENAPDPLMPYYEEASEDSSIIIFDGTSDVPTSEFGVMDLSVWDRPCRENTDAMFGILHRTKTPRGRILGKSFSLPLPFSNQKAFVGRWVKMTPPSAHDPDQLLAAVEAELDKHAVMRPAEVAKLRPSNGDSALVTGIVFPEEISYSSGGIGAGWLFLVTRSMIGDDGKKKLNVSLVRGARATEADIFARLPVAKAIRKKRALLVGCGAVGSFVGQELARAGIGQITFLDSEVVEPGNSLRWPLGMTAWGRQKAQVLADWVVQNYPWTKAALHIQRIGVATSSEEYLPEGFAAHPSIWTQIEDAVAEVDLIIDTSASLEVQQAMAFFADRQNKPYLMGYCTMGLVGGVVASFSPTTPGCLVCLHEHWKDENIPEPLADEDRVVSPVGCNATTFEGGAYDLKEVSLEVTRRAIGILSGGKYDSGDWDVALLQMQDSGGRVLPKWDSFDCPAHPSCCGGKS